MLEGNGTKGGKGKGREKSGVALATAEAKEEEGRYVTLKPDYSVPTLLDSSWWFGPCFVGWLTYRSRGRRRPRRSYADMTPDMADEMMLDDDAR